MVGVFCVQSLRFEVLLMLLWGMRGGYCLTVCYVVNRSSVR